jgi:hypothetical protein
MPITFHHNSMPSFFKPQAQGSRFLQNVGINLPQYTVPYPGHTIWEVYEKNVMLW